MKTPIQILKKSDYFTRRKQRFEKALASFLPPKITCPKRLYEAMRYAALDGGKRIRPLLVYTTGDVLGANIFCLDQVACAVECIHVYSLIHDDLPAMDNDELRRNKPSCHIAFDEATAILAGNALQSLAFEKIANIEAEILSPWMRLAIIKTLSKASGVEGIIGGQILDLESVGKTLSPGELKEMHELKTGSLIQASVKVGALASNVDDPQLLKELALYSENLGLAFQIQDDILDITETTDKLGKPSGSDVSQNKPTYPSILGMDVAQTKMQQHYQAAMDALNDMPFDTTYLAKLTDRLLHRKN